MANCRVQVLDEVIDRSQAPWLLCLQRCRYIYDGGKPSDFEEGFRFIWRRPDGTLQAARGQARLPSLQIMRLLTAQAEEAGWGYFNADNEQRRFIEPVAVAA